MATNVWYLCTKTTAILTFAIDFKIPHRTGSGVEGHLHTYPLPQGGCSLFNAALYRPQLPPVLYGLWHLGPFPRMPQHSKLRTKKQGEGIALSHDALACG